MTKIFIVFVALAGFFVMGGCATTLFFPAKPAETAADKVIDDVWHDLAKPAATELKKP